MWEMIRDFLAGSFVMFLIGSAISIVGAAIKKGDVERIGVGVGKIISKIGSTRFGKSVWEKVEDTLLNLIISFVEGIKKGADLDDLDIDERKTKIQENKTDKK